MEEKKSPEKAPAKPTGKSYGMAKTPDGNFQVIRVTFRGRQILDYEVLATTTFLGDARMLMHSQIVKDEYSEIR